MNQRNVVGDELHKAVDRFLTPRTSPAKPRDQELLQQGTALSLACGLAATAWGKGPTVLLAHGWESRGTHWGAFVPPLVEAGFRAVAVDAPAHGDSPGRRANVLQYGLSLVEVGADRAAGGDRGTLVRGRRNRDCRSSGSHGRARGVD